MNPIAIIAFAGPAGSGKDTAGRYLIEKFGFQKLSFATPLKLMLAAMGYPEPATQDAKEALIPELGHSWRYLAQTIGTEWGREVVHPDVWTILAERLIREQGGRWVITDLRFENEATMVRRMNGVIGVLDGREHEMTGKTKAHRSELGIDYNEHDVTIDNAPVMVECSENDDEPKEIEDMRASMNKLAEQLDHLVKYVGVA